LLAYENPEQHLWTLARNASGWGRIHAVERLAEVTTSPDIKDWLLREGYKNSILNEYLACTCAVAGGLLSALQQDGIDDQLLDAAGEMIDAILLRGPAESIDDYPDGAPVVECYLEHLVVRAHTLDQVLVVQHLRRFLEDDSADWGGRGARGWTDSRRASLLGMCGTILARPEWPALASAGLSTDDDSLLHKSFFATRDLGIDPWEPIVAAVRRRPLCSMRWYLLMECCNERRIAEVVGMAEQLLPLASIGTGPADDFGFGDDRVPHQCLGFILQALAAYPGEGMTLIETGLKSPVTHNRFMATRALAACPRDRWPENIRKVLRNARGLEPTARLRENMKRVLDGEAFV